MRILRLSIFNIRKRKKEAFVIIVLLTISMTMMGLGLINFEKAGRMFEEAFNRTGSYRNLFQMPKKSYKTEYGEAVQADERITRSCVIEMLEFDTSTAISYKKADGSTSNFYSIFVTEEDEKRLERFEGSLPEGRVLAHPIWVPYYLKYDLGFQVGDELVLVIGGKEYPYTIADFYESGLWSNANTAFKCVLTEADYATMSKLMPARTLIACDTKEGVIENALDAVKLVKEFEEKFEEISGTNVFLFNNEYYNEKNSATMSIQIVMAIVAFISVVTTVSCLFLIRHKITNDIEDQMENIGVLEALGYRGKEISGAFTGEYLLLSLVGIVLGVILILLTDPLMSKVLQVFIGHEYITGGKAVYLFLPALLLGFLTLVTALMKAAKIKKVPPVLALRKGIGPHHFGKNFFPVEKTKADINRRLGLKNLMGHMRQNVGMFICILAAALTFTFCVYLCDLFRNRGEVFTRVSGLEEALMVGFERETDIELVKQEIVERDDVRKVVELRADNGFSIDHDSINFFQIFAYGDFKELESLIITEGRVPLHENELLVGSGLADKYKLKCGDSVKLCFEGIEANVIVSGIAKCLMNNGMMGYMTTPGFFQFKSPEECLAYLFVYHGKGTTDAELKERLVKTYKSLESLAEKSSEEGSLEERIRAKAEQQMAILMEKYGVDNASYAIKVNGTIISQNSASFSIKEISSLSETIETVLGGISVMAQIFSLILMGIIAVVVGLILNFLIESTIKKEKQAMGIEKAMGYTTKDLKRQIVFRIMPVALPAILLGACLALPVFDAFQKAAFAVGMNMRLFWIPVSVVLVAALVYSATIISAGKVKKISVTELMTE